MQLPHKEFLLLHSGLVCPNMKKTRLESVYEALRNNEYEIQVPDNLANQARQTLERMLAVK